ncbi:MAG: glucose 1-dehydrogenase [Burkholderiales bacterium]
MTNTSRPARVAIVTGAADGIGWATAQQFATQVDHVALLDLREGAVCERATELGSAHVGIGCDVCVAESVAAAVRVVLERFGRVDVLVNNAGIGDQAGATIDQTVEAFDRVLGVHLRGTFLMSREVAPGMLAQGGGAIVNIASIAAAAGVPMRNAYGAAKAGIAAMTRSMACEWASRGLRVNAVAPGYVRTALVDELARKGALNTKAIDERTPMGRMGRPDEIAKVIAFLASDDASYITGTVLNVDGGWLAFGGTIPAVPPVVASGA